MKRIKSKNQKKPILKLRMLLSLLRNECQKSAIKFYATVTTLHEQYTCLFEGRFEVSHSTERDLVIWTLWNSQIIHAVILFSQLIFPQLVSFKLFCKSKYILLWYFLLSLIADFNKDPSVRQGVCMVQITQKLPGTCSVTQYMFC